MTMLTGAQVLLITPFDDDGEIDEASLANLVEFVLADGVDGLIALGTTGEFFTLDPGERAMVMQLVTRLVKGRTPVSFGVGDTSTRTSLELAAQAERLGAACVMLPPPYYFAHSPAALEAHFHTVASGVDLPLMVYDGAGGIEFSLEQLRRLHEQKPTVKYVKLSVPSPEKVQAVATGVPSLGVFCGDEQMLVLALRNGAAGSTLGCGNILPGVVVAIHRAFAAGDIHAARKLQLGALIQAVSVCTTAKSEYIRCYKEVLAAKGIIRSPATRPPLQPLEPTRREEVLAVMAEIGAL